MLQKPYDKKQFNLPKVVKKGTRPEREDLKSILDLENFFSTWNSFNVTNGDTEWETLLASSNSSTSAKNDSREVGSFLHELFEHTRIGKFEYYHRAGKSTYSCEHKYGQNEGKIIEKFITDIIKKELGVSNIFVISKDNHISIVFR